MSKRSVVTMMGSPATADTAPDVASAGGVWAAVGAAFGAVSGVVGDGIPGVETVAGGGFGALCFCHASHNRSAENEKTTRAMRRWVSIMSRHRIEAARAPRMASGDTPRGEARAFHGAVLVHGLGCVFGTAGRKATLPAPPRAQQIPIGPNQRE